LSSGYVFRAAERLSAFSALQIDFFCFAAKKHAPGEKYIGADLPGFFVVLHTWAGPCYIHPHIHYIVACEALSSSDQRWRSSR
jgi:hypothetical protein